MRILITGANGQLGTELCRVFPSDTVIPKDLPDFDLTGPTVEQEIIKAKPDLIIHAAAYTDVDGAEREPGRALAINASGTEQIAQAAALVGARLIYISTDYVFSGHKQTPYIEEDVPAPINAYGLSKWRGEQAVQRSGARALIIRTAWLYGASGGNFVKSILQAARMQPMLRVVDDQHGCPTYANDLAAVIAALAKRDVGGILHVTNQGHCTWHEFAVAIVREMGLDLPIIPIPTREAGRLAQRPGYSVLSLDRLQSLGMTVRPWREALSVFLKAKQPLLAAHR